ncbi:NmrA family transcriptional regulator [Sinosporangium album]|nr:NmrA family transcriptional regulator [Sinosporangium album]
MDAKIFIVQPLSGGMAGMSSREILITAPTGRTGSRVAARIEGAGFVARRASRSTEVRFDWHDETTWNDALAGVHAAYLCYSPDLAIPGTDQIIAAFAERAAVHGVDKLVLLSGRGEAGAEACERAVFAASPSAVVLRCAWFQENFSEHFLTWPVRQGRIAVPAGQTPEPFISLDDIADIAHLALTTGAHAGEVLELTGPEALTFAQVAKILSEARGQTVVYEPLETSAFISEQCEAGLDRESAEALAWLFAEVLDGRNVDTTDTVQRVLGRLARPFAGYARAAAEAGAWA